MSFLRQKVREEHRRRQDWEATEGGLFGLSHDDVTAFVRPDETDDTLLLPHTFESLNRIPDVHPEQAFWAFVARIDLIEEASGIRFPGLPDSMKELWGDSFFLSRRTGREIRSQSCGLGAPQGVVENSTKQARIAMCTDRLN